MTMIDIFRKVLPIRVRQDLGLWLLTLSAKSKATLYPYLYFLCGYFPKDMTLLPHGDCSVNYRGRDIISPKDGILAFVEVFQDRVYEKIWSPKKDNVVIDVGAYVGMFTVRASGLVNANGRVIAIEPSPKNFSYLKQNTKGLNNVTLIRAIASSRNGIGKLYLSKATPCHTTVYQHHNSIGVKMITLDSLNVKADFIKIDAEGSELEILRGAEETLARGTRLAIACYHELPKGQKELPPVIDFLEARGYKVIVRQKYVYAELEKTLQ